MAEQKTAIDQMARGFQIALQQWSSSVELAAKDQYRVSDIETDRRTIREMHKRLTNLASEAGLTLEVIHQ
jgi:hypothetical protein